MDRHSSKTQGRPLEKRLTRAVRTPGAFVRPLGVAFAEVWPTTSTLTWANRWDHFLARWGYRRSRHRVRPGLYALGHPNPDSPVLVTANYTLSFDAVRSALVGYDAYILVLDTQGINVWCAAGKGTFGTEELVRRIGATGLAQVVRHRRLILPQLGAPGIAAHEVRRRTGFRVEYGPVRARDLPYYLEHGEATPEMRRVRFGLWDRAVLIPIEFVHGFTPMIIAGVVLYFLLGQWGAIATAAAFAGGTILFPLLLPYLPAREFSVKGFLLGGVLSLAVGWGAWQDAPLWPLVARLGRAAGLALGSTAVIAYLALNFTGATPLTSQTGVAREMRRYIRPMVALAALAILLTISIAIWRYMEG